MSIDIKLETVVSLVIANHPGVVADIKDEEPGAFPFLVGQVIRVTHGTVKPCYIEKELKKQLEEKKLET